MDMPVPNMTKYVYRIRCNNGALVEHLQIYGETESLARERLMQMYRNCEVLEVSVAVTSRQVSTDFADVLSNIVDSD
jgi:hypothetical protein